MRDIEKNEQVAEKDEAKTESTELTLVDDMIGDLVNGGGPSNSKCYFQSC